jgi:hypothetical protein
MPPPEPRPEPVLRRHTDHDPVLICRPALGYGLCEVLGDEERSEEEGRCHHDGGYHPQCARCNQRPAKPGDLL